MRNAEPNEAHYILSEMEKEGIIAGVITQNIDNLHQKAGSKKSLRSSWKYERRKLFKMRGEGEF
jgi:NAD-dependent SIR2 family protein deacetylase